MYSWQSEDRVWSFPTRTQRRPPVTKVEKSRTLKETLSCYFCLLYLNVGTQESWKLNTYSSQQLFCTQISVSIWTGFGAAPMPTSLQLLSACKPPYTCLEIAHCLAGTFCTALQWKTLLSSQAHYSTIRLGLLKQETKAALYPLSFYQFASWHHF